ncbi:hypothetical protein Slala05_60600 [Streptomyces lavendulae subsp. lavendulae]|nr:hypothetical protein Slala05_60600 [Streptomyces lavendulae subsp. lavendulae]
MLPGAVPPSAQDDSVRLLADTSASGAGVYAVRDPARSPGVLRELEWLAGEDVYKDPAFRREVITWLERGPQRWTPGCGPSRARATDRRRPGAGGGMSLPFSLRHAARGGSAG